MAAKPEGWGETPLSVQWAWPSAITYQERFDAMEAFCRVLVEAYSSFPRQGIRWRSANAFLEHGLPGILSQFNERHRADAEPMPYLAALICCSAFDIALHDAYGVLHEVPTYETYNAKYMSQDLSKFLRSAPDASVSFAGKYPEDFLVKQHSRVAAGVASGWRKGLARGIGDR